MSSLPPSALRLGAGTAARRMRRIMWLQLALVAGVVLLVVLGHWSPLLQGGTTLIAAFLAVVLSCVAVLAHIARPSSGPVTASERRSGRNVIMRWIFPTITLLAPFVVTLLLALVIYPPGSANPGSLVSVLLSRHERPEEKLVPLKQFARAAERHLVDQGRSAWTIGQDEALIREAVLSSFATGGSQGDSVVAADRLPSWVRASVELAVLRAAPRYWKISRLCYVSADASAAPSLKAALGADLGYYAITGNPPLITVDTPSSDSNGNTMPVLSKGYYLPDGGRWNLCLLMDARSTSQPGPHQLRLQSGATIDVILPAGSLGRWVLWTAVVNEEPKEIYSANNKDPLFPVRCDLLSYATCLPDPAVVQTRMTNEIASLDPRDQIPIFVSASSGNMVARPASRTGVLVIAASPGDADEIDRWVNDAFQGFAIANTRNSEVSTTAQIGSLRIRAEAGVGTFPAAIEQAQFGPHSDTVYLYRTNKWMELQPLAVWAFSYPGLFWEDFETSHRPELPDGFQIVPFWSRLVIEVEGRTIIGYLVTMPRSNNGPTAPNPAQSACDQDLLWSVLNESGRRLAQDQLLLKNGMHSLDMPAGVYVPVMRTEDLLQISSLRVRRDLTFAILILLVYSVCLVAAHAKFSNLSRESSTSL